MVAEDRVASRHIRSGVFSRDGLGSVIRKRVTGNSPVDFLEQFFVDRMLRILHHILECLEVVKHFECLEKRLSRRNHSQSFLLQLSGIIYGERVAFNGARMSGKEHLVIFDVLFSIHLIDNRGLVLLPYRLVFFYFCV